MRNFDEERRGRQKSGPDRTFNLGGETFMVKAAVKPEALGGFDRLQALGDNPDIADAMALIDEIILKLLVDPREAEPRYRAVRDNEDDPIDSETLKNLMEWAVEIATGTPIQRPSVSTPSQAQTGNGSTADSSSPDLRAVPTP